MPDWDEMVVALEVATPDLSGKLTDMQIVRDGNCGQQDRRQNGERDSPRSEAAKPGSAAAVVAARKPKSPEGDNDRHPCGIEKEFQNELR